VTARIAVADWRRGGESFVHEGHEIFCRSGGERHEPALLLIHGFPTASWDWEGIWDALAKHFRLLTLDMLGFGFSAKPRPHGYCIRAQADLFEAFLARAAVGDYHVLAHDYGDTVAQELLARQGEPGPRPRVRSATLLNGGLFPETHRPVLVQRLLASPLGPWVARSIDRERFAASLKRVFGPATPPSEELVAGAWTLLTHDDGAAVMPLLIRYMSERRAHRERWVGALFAAQVPIKLIVGAADPISGQHVAERYRELVPAPDIALLPGIGHYPQCEAGEAVLEAFLAFHRNQGRAT
jgi:pimeloyl-ACP methyl ester carboxylesterase